MVRSFILMRMVSFQAHQLIHSHKKQQILSLDFTKNNAAYDSTKASFELVDGYLTADSWYRPKEILEAGNNLESVN